MGRQEGERQRKGGRGKKENQSCKVGQAVLPAEPAGQPPGPRGGFLHLPRLRASRQPHLQLHSLGP